MTKANSEIVFDAHRSSEQNAADLRATLQSPWAIAAILPTFRCLRQLLMIQMKWFGSTPPGRSRELTTTALFRSLLLFCLNFGLLRRHVASQHCILTLSTSV